MEADTFKASEKILVQIRKAIFSQAGIVLWPRIDMPSSVKERFGEVGLSHLGTGSNVWEVLPGHAGDQCPLSSTGHGAGVRLPSGTMGARAADRVLQTSHSFAQQMSIESKTCARNSSRHHGHRMTTTCPVPVFVETVSQWSRQKHKGCHQTSAGESKRTVTEQMAESWASGWREHLAHSGLGKTSDAVGPESRAAGHGRSSDGARNRRASLPGQGTSALTF